MKLTQMIRTGLAALACALCLTGCIRQQVTITSDPPCAKVWINGVYRGETPVEVPYNWSWVYDVRVEKAGYETINARETFSAPQSIPPIDVVAEATPWRNRDCQWRHYCLPRQKPL